MGNPEIDAVSLSAVKNLKAKKLKGKSESCTP
jgi:hypothetical protein